jgi:hypothetical protein
VEATGGEVQAGEGEEGADKAFRFVLLPWAHRILDGFGGLHVRARDGRRARTALLKWPKGNEAGLWVPWSREFRGVWRRVRPEGSSQDSSIVRSVLLFRSEKKENKNRAARPDWSSRLKSKID